jgi:rhamnosyl/mannosyltransferase
MVTSERLFDNSEILSPHSEKCKVVPLSIDLEAVDNETVININIDVSGPGVLLVGRLNHYKGVEYLTDAMAEASGTLLIAGEGEHREVLERRVSDKGVEDRIHFLGYVSDEKLAGAYQLADLFVLPSVERSEAFGIVQLEAMARGVPVVNTDLPTGVPWVSKGGQTGLTVPPRDVEALADAIEFLIEDEERRLRYGKQARERVEQKFTRDTMIQRVVDIYDNIQKSH